MTVVFTGDHPRYERSQLQSHAISIGLVPQPGVTKSTDLVAAMDPESNSGKAIKAHRYGIPLVSIDQLVNAHTGATLEAIGQQSAALKVTTCPDCHATLAIPAIAGGATIKRCNECAKASAAQARRSTPQQPRGMWAPPIIEWLICRTCSRTWHREVIKGRKPHACPACAPATHPLPIPTP